MAETHDDLTTARMRALLVRSPMAMAFVNQQRFELVSESFNHLYGYGDDTDLTGSGVKELGGDTIEGHADSGGGAGSGEVGAA